MTYNIYKLDLDNTNEEEIAFDLSFGELAQYVLDLISEEDISEDELNEIDQAIYNNVYMPLVKALESSDNFIFFTDYKIYITKN